MEIQIKTIFSGWCGASKETALDWAQHKLYAITTMRNDEERLEYINSKLSGIQFSLEELYDNNPYGRGTRETQSIGAGTDETKITH